MVTLPTDLDPNNNDTGVPDTTGQKDPNGHNPLEGDLRYVIFQADQVANANSTITFQVGSVTLAEGELPIFQNMTIIGPVGSPVTVSGNNILRPRISVLPR